MCHELVPECQVAIETFVFLELERHVPSICN
jgi:hypothetical protein